MGFSNSFAKKSAADKHGEFLKTKDSCECGKNDGWSIKEIWYQKVPMVSPYGTKLQETAGIVANILKPFCRTIGKKVEMLMGRAADGRIRHDAVVILCYCDGCSKRITKVFEYGQYGRIERYGYYGIIFLNSVKYIVNEGLNWKFSEFTKQYCRKLKQLNLDWGSHLYAVGVKDCQVWAKKILYNIVLPTLEQHKKEKACDGSGFVIANVTALGMINNIVCYSSDGFALYHISLDNLAGRMRELVTPFKFDFLAMNENKLNLADCGRKLAISLGGLVVKHTGPDSASNCVRAQSPIPKFNLNAKNGSIVYFEVEIVANWWNIRIGFCTQQFPLEGNWLGNEQNSIGIWHKRGIWIDETSTKFNNGGGHFQAREVIGIGIVHFPAISTLKCFATCNGQLLGKADLPIKYANLHLFPAVSMYFENDSIQANFGRDPWQFNAILEHLAN